LDVEQDVNINKSAIEDVNKCTVFILKYLYVFILFVLHDKT